ncbi:hypothetical protein B0H67DRAFT_532255 [Lasiosphaeris hirsuta]|uniref:Uncharacterized protein n=1 Tax=Lasiosphaeris hirsuta TaxID=260670 RepID=A0AA40E2R7_9PEZI|nr:hypothetical protein B0H67DRAFT_532255 [Lasiosphaeris hirsuta]
MYFSVLTPLAVLGFLAQISTATSCSSSNAIPIEQYLGSSSGGGSGGVGGVFLSYDIFNIVSQAVKKRTPDASIANVGMLLHSRAVSPECAASELCLSVQGDPFCLDAITGDFHDGSGTKGNAITGDYTLGDGRKGNLYKGPYPLPEGAGSTAATTTAATSRSAVTGTPSAGAGAGTEIGVDAATATATASGGAKPTSTPNGATIGKSGGTVLGGFLAMLGAGLL